MNDTRKRLIGYSLASVVFAGLLICGFGYKPDADTMTLLGSVEVHLKLASSIPEVDRYGQPDSVRAKLLKDGRAYLARARRQEPDLFLGLEYEAWLSALEGDFRASAVMYRKAQSGNRATAETKVADLLNEVRMWRAAKDPRRAMTAMDRWHGDFSAEDAELAVVERMLVCEDLADTESASKWAHHLTDSSTKPMALLEAGHCFQRAGNLADAERAYTAAAAIDGVANYYVATLKVGAQEFDTALELLDRAIAVKRPLVRDMLMRDSDTWDPVRGDERFEELYLLASEAASPGR